VNGSLYNVIKDSFKEIGKNSYFNQEQLNRFKKFNVYRNLVEENKLGKKRIGSLSVSMDKQQYYYNKFYKNGFMSLTGPSGSIQYYTFLYLIFVNDNKDLFYKLTDGYGEIVRMMF